MARIRPITGLKAPKAAVYGVGVIEGAIAPAKAVIGTGAVTSTVARASASGTVQGGGDVVSSFAFAEIPEIVFVRGIPEADDLAPFILDPQNRIWPGDLGWLEHALIQRHPDHPEGAGAWTARQAVDLIGTLPAGVTWDATYCRLLYDPTAQGAGKEALSETVTLRLSANGIQSNEFALRILVPTIVYGDNAATINATMGWGATKVVTRDYATANHWDKAFRLQTAQATHAAPNVLFVTPGRYDAADGEVFYFQATSNPTASYNTYYILSDSRSPAELDAYGGGKTVFRMTQQYSDFFYIKNFDCEAITFATQTPYSLRNEPTYGKRPYRKYITKINQHDSYTNNDFIGTALAEGPDGGGPSYAGTVCHIWNMRQSKLGGSGNTYHSMYLEGRPFTNVRINNIFIDGTRLCSAIQSTVFDFAILNSRLYVVPDADPTYTGYRCTDLLDIHSCNYAVAYNNHFVTGASRAIGSTNYRGCLSGPIFLENRRPLWGGNDVPPYPNATWQRLPDDGNSFVAWSVVFENCGVSGAVVNELGLAQYGATQGGPWINLSSPARWVGTPTSKDWEITVLPGEIPNGSWLVRIIAASGDISSNPKQLGVFQSATQLAATTFWDYAYPITAGFDLNSVETYVNPAFWAAVAARPPQDFEHPLRYRHWYSYNKFVWLDFTGEEQLDTPLTRVAGTQPTEAPWQFAAPTIFKRAPEGFVERSTAFWCNNTLVNAKLAGNALFRTDDPGFTLQGTTAQNGLEVIQLWEPGNLWSPADIVEMGSNPANYPLAQGPGVPDRPWFDLGGNNFTDPSQTPTFVQLPAGFRISKPKD